MTSGVYIKGIGNISCQETHNGEVLKNAFTKHDGNRWKCFEPDYSAFIDAKQIRRMSRIIRMSVTSSMIALKEAGISNPDAVIVGTAFGCLDDTYAFLSKLVQYKEDMLSPTAFIHSTHNTIAAQIALHYKCYGYNSTYVHRNISFESALTDSIMMLEAGEVTNVLVGGADEIIDAGFAIMDRMNFFKENDQVTSSGIYDLHSDGTVAGEGATFFTLVNKFDEKCIAKITAVETWSFMSKEEVCENIKIFLTKNGTTNPDYVLAGNNGDEQQDNITSSIVNTFSNKSNLFNYKHLCGEFGSSSAFATWLAASMLNKQVLPGKDRFEPALSEFKNILIYNQLNNIHHSVILVQSC